MSRAIHIVAIGKRTYHREALAFIMHLREWNINDKIYVHTNNPRWPTWARDTGAVIALHTKIEEDLRTAGYGGDYYLSRMIRLKVINQFSADLNLMLDTDLVAIKDPSKIWEQIPEDAEMAMTVESYKNLADLWLKHRAKDGVKPEEWMYMAKAKYIRKDVKLWHGGLILWRKGQVATEFFSRWFEEWKRFKHRDQSALARAMEDNPEIRGKLADVPKKWMQYIMNKNFWERNPPKGSDEMIFLHSHIGARQFYRELWIQSGEIIPRFPTQRKV